MAQPQTNRIKVGNPPLKDYQRTYLNADVDSSASSLSVLAKEGFFKADHNNDTYFYVIIGEYGHEKTEIRRVTAEPYDTANTTIDLTGDTLRYGHSASEPVTFIPYNKIKFFGRTSSGGSNNPLDTLNIDPTQQYTEFIYEGTDYSYFVARYYNSENDEESASSSEIETSSFGRKSAKRIIESAIRKAMTKIDEGSNSVLTWDIGLEVLEDGIDEIITRKRKWPFLHTIKADTTTTSGTAYISKPSNLAKLEYLVIDDYKLDWMSRMEYDDYTKAGATVSTGSPSHYTEKNDKFYLYPTPNASYDIIYEYFKIPASITSLSDTINYQFVPILIYYCGSQFAYIRGNDKRGDKLYEMFTKQLENQAVEYSGPWQAGDAEYVQKTKFGDNTYSLIDEY